MQITHVGEILPQLLTIDFKLDSSNGKSQWDNRISEKITFGNRIIFQNKGIASVLLDQTFHALLKE